MSVTHFVSAAKKVLLGASILAATAIPTVARAEFQPPVGLNQRVLVVCLKFSGDTPRKTAGQWISTLNTEVNDFLTMATYGTTSFQFVRPTGDGVPADGWFDLGFPVEDWPGTTQGAIIAARLADPYVNMGSFNRIFVITSHEGFGGQCTDYNWIPVNEGSESREIIDGTRTDVRLMSVAAANEWLPNSYWAANTRDEAASVMAHELGHELRIPLHYGDVLWTPNMTRDTITPWDNMGLSPGWNNILSWAKVKQGWLSLDSVLRVGPPAGTNIDRTESLRALHSTSGRRAIRVPFTTGETFDGYYVELRTNDGIATSRDAWGTPLPQGVLVSYVTEAPGVPFALNCQVMENARNPGQLNRATLQVGDVFEDTAHNLRITCMGISGNTADVRIQYNATGTDIDPMVTPWGSPPYETPDIWIDSQQNGWGTYRYVDPSGNPEGNGDPAWVRQMPDDSWTQNRVHVRIRNIGLNALSNVQVNVYVNDPPGLGDSGAGWAHIGSFMVPTMAGLSSATGYVNWYPTVDRHTCLRAVITNYANERTTANNMAQENVSSFETTASSPYQPVELKMKVQNPLYTEIPVEFNVSDIPKGWTWEVIPKRATLASQGSADVRLRMLPPNPVNVPRYKQGQVFRPKIVAMFPHGDNMIPYGGVEMWTHLVYKASIVLTSVHMDPGTGDLTVKGRLSQQQPTEGPLADQKVAVMVARNDQQSYYFVRNPKTNALGNFTAVFRGLKPGKWVVQGSWAGNMTHQSCETGSQDVFF